jgi:hypothetical protein
MDWSVLPQLPNDTPSLAFPFRHLCQLKAYFH